MIRILLVICCSFFVPQNDSVLSWNDSYELSWIDFKAKPNNKVNATAVTASGITFGFSIRESNSCPVSYTTEVHAHFYPEKSWFKQELANNHVLVHEQLHFDITELHARKFRQQINELKISNTIKNDLRNLHKDTNKALEKMQNKYDAETNFSRNIEFQYKWQLYIDEELKKLSKYKSVD